MESQFRPNGYELRRVDTIRLQPMESQFQPNRTARQATGT